MAKLSIRCGAAAPGIAREQAETADGKPDRLSTREKLIGFALASPLLLVIAIVVKTIAS